MAAPQFDLPRKQITFSDMPEVVSKRVNSFYRVLVLAEGEVAPVLEAVHTQVLPERAKIDVDCSGCEDMRDLLNKLGSALAQSHGGSFVEKDQVPIYIIHDIFDMLREATSYCGDIREQPLLVFHDVPPEAATAVFARGRDELWGFNFPCVVVAPATDKDHYLLYYSDSFFMNDIFLVAPPEPAEPAEQ